jgi:1,2-dihydroxy-3-keto-5-methylthiopentene dioxygenase
LDENDFIKALRLFQVRKRFNLSCLGSESFIYQDEPKWVPHNRNAETDANPYRVDYLKTIGVGA